MDTQYQKIKETAQGLFAKRICGTLTDKIKTTELDVDFDFVGFVDGCELPCCGDLSEHEYIWGLFHEKFEVEYRNYRASKR